MSGMAAAQTLADRRELEALPTKFSLAWAHHDGHELAAIMSENVDFVTVGATWFQGRPNFELYHTRLLNGRFSHSTITPLQRRIRSIRPDLAVVHWSWRIEGDRNFDGSPRPPRVGLMTMLAEKRSGRWLVIVSQNSNGTPGHAPEEEGIAFPIELPEVASAGGK